MGARVRLCGGLNYGFTNRYDFVFLGLAQRLRQLREVGRDPRRLIAGKHPRFAAERLSRDSAELLNKDSVDVGVDTYYKRVGTCYFARRIRQFR
jgi:hypothetical protein